MSEYTEGKVVAHQSGVRAFLLSEKDDDVAFDISKEDARRLAAAWNACEGMATEAIEALAGIGSLGDLKASELNAARALLREVVKNIQECDTGGIFDPEKMKIRAYLDACDKPGAPHAS